MVETKIGFLLPSKTTELMIEIKATLVLLFVTWCSTVPLLMVNLTWRRPPKWLH